MAIRVVKFSSGGRGELLEKKSMRGLRLWQYGLSSFQAGGGGSELEIFLPKNRHTQFW